MKMGREYIIQGRVQGVGFRFYLSMDEETTNNGICLEP